MALSRFEDLCYGTAIARELTRKLPIGDLHTLFCYTHFAHECRPDVIAQALLDPNVPFPKLNPMEQEACELYTNLHRPPHFEKASRHDLCKVALACCMCNRVYIGNDDVDNLLIRLPLMFLATTFLPATITRLGLDCATWLRDTAPSVTSRYLCQVIELFYHAWLSNRISSAILAFHVTAAQTTGEEIEEFWQEPYNRPESLMSWCAAWKRAFQVSSDTAEATDSLAKALGIPT